ncbi:MAG: helix-hairpin-helix domain-containing protein [Chlorobium sp.]
MKLLEKLAVKLSLTKAEITLVSALLGFLVLGGILKNIRSIEKADVQVKKVETARYREAEVDSLISIATADQASVQEDVMKGIASGKSSSETPKRASQHSSEKKIFSGTISFNKAGIGQLQKIPGVGPVMAERLITFRTAQGGKVHEFEEFLEVKGVGEKKLEFLKKYFTLE